MARLSPTPISEITDPSRRVLRLNVHGLATELRCSLPGLRQVFADLFDSMLVDEWPDGFQPIDGTIEPYDADVVARHLSPRADQVAVFGDSGELWRDGDRCWLLDDGWGLSEINLPKRSWRSWLLPQATLDPVRALEQAILWPLSQVMAPRGLALVPAASVVHRGRGILIASPFSLEPELSNLLAVGHGLIGQRWTAIREDDGRPVLLQMPGRVERSPVPQLRSKLRPTAITLTTGPEWADLAAEGACLCNYAWCDMILLIEPGRRAVARMTPLTGASATAAVRRAWPMPDLSASGRHGQLATRLGQTCPVYQVELSRDPNALLRMVEQIPAEIASRGSLRPSVKKRSEAHALAS